MAGSCFLLPNFLPISSLLLSLRKAPSHFYFEIEEESGLRRYGKSKENRPNPIVQMGLFMDYSGLPLAMTITNGNENEQKTLLPLEKKSSATLSSQTL